jgi:hypothetical protein
LNSAGTQLRAATAQADAKYRFDIGAALVLGVVLYVAIAVLHTPAAVIIVLLLAFARVMPVSGLERASSPDPDMLPDLAAILDLVTQPRTRGGPLGVGPFVCSGVLDSVSFR